MDIKLISYKNTNKLIANENGANRKWSIITPGNFTISQNQVKKELTGIGFQKGNFTRRPI